MKKAFTIIELAFVIVIIGVLASIALPRFVTMNENAHMVKIYTFVDTLNRTVAPIIWSGLLRNVPASKGSFKHPSVSSIRKYNTIFDTKTSSPVNAIDAQLQQIPTEITTNPDGISGAGATHDISLAACANSNISIDVGVGTIAYAKIGDTVYQIGCIDGNISHAPHFFIDDGSQIIRQ